MWESIKEANQSMAHSERLKVPDGWIVRTIIYSGTGHVHSSQTFVKDLEHSWKLES